MRAVIQRVSRSRVSVNGRTTGEIGKGFLVLLGIRQDDTEDNIAKLAEKVIKLRVFEDGAGKMNLALGDVGGAALVVSQFTLYGDTAGQNRPSFIKAARPEKALPFYEKFVKHLSDRGIPTATGEFGAMMEVELTNDGPVTIIIDI